MTSEFSRRTILRGMAALSVLAMPLLHGSGRRLRAATLDEEANAMSKEEFPPVDFSKEEWRERLDPEAFDILFREKTERAFTSPLNEEKRDGTYVCAACYLPLFLSDMKFDSGTGWPSFYTHIEGRIGTKRDFRLIIPRTEYHCIRCGGHQGHVFSDGPEPTGQRWCNNGRALRFVPEGEPLPALRGQRQDG
ncbi:peptide-methionine (R)-S-oxide reductase MsrB [Natronospira bacteriovora]|uniref:peptide-methionine (R)-S-oxide reductase n=1 Tax=Natronospira bacteriovora TaxID=3069753 RepID=A0ABU0W4G0_9GAMM|nr:peptide-methionine (R)-S-oxide reductase MsrB [Natronospira sp. AB-CW4]MDQ2068907.1 peptide-methionine (R)-S-oxide reductase MsrB [Natronospira sp. AB-CW4]